MRPDQRIPELKRLLLRVLSAVEVSAADVGLRIDSVRGEARVALAGETTRFGLEDRDWQLNWERLTSRILEKAASVRLHRLARLKGEHRPGAWSVVATTFTVDWLVWNAGGTGSSEWQADVEAILKAADGEREIAIASRAARSGKGLRGHLRSRRLHAQIDLGEAQYLASNSCLRANALIPATVVSGLAGHPLGSYLDHPAVRGRVYRLRKVSVSQEGTEFELDEGWKSLETDDPETPPSDAAATEPWQLDELKALHLRQLLLQGSRFCRGSEATVRKVCNG